MLSVSTLCLLLHGRAELPGAEPQSTFRRHPRCADWNSGAAHEEFHDGLLRLATTHRSELFLIANGGSPSQGGTDHRSVERVKADFEKAKRELGVSAIDMFVLQYIQPYEVRSCTHAPAAARPAGSVLTQCVHRPGCQDPAVVHAALDVLVELKARGELRYIAMSTHDFDAVTPVIESEKLDAAMLRYNMAHKSAEREAFPACLATGVPVLAFTTTRWNTLQSGHQRWDAPPPSTADCVSYALTHPAVTHVINGVRTIAELDQILGGMWAAPLDQTNASFATWDEYGKLVYSDQENLVQAADTFDAVGTVEEPVCKRAHILDHD